MRYFVLLALGLINALPVHAESGTAYFDKALDFNVPNHSPSLLHNGVVFADTATLKVLSHAKQVDGKLQIPAFISAIDNPAETERYFIGDTINYPLDVGDLIGPTNLAYRNRQKNPEHWAAASATWLEYIESRRKQLEAADTIIFPILGLGAHTVKPYDPRRGLFVSNVQARKACLRINETSQTPVLGPKGADLHVCLTLTGLETGNAFTRVEASQAEADEMLRSFRQAGGGTIPMIFVECNKADLNINNDAKFINVGSVRYDLDYGTCAVKRLHYGAMNFKGVKVVATIVKNSR